MGLSATAERIIFIFASIILLLLAYLAYSRIQSLIKSYDQVSHTRVVELRLEQALSYLKDAETAQRGFLLTNDSTFLEPFYESEKNITATLDDIQKQAVNNPKQQKNLIVLKGLAHVHLNNLRYTLKQQYTPQDLQIELQRAKKLMDTIRLQVGKMKQTEASILKQREGEKDRYVSITPLALLFLILSVLIIIGFSYYRVTTQLRLSRSYAHNLNRLYEEITLNNKQLESSNEDLRSFTYIASHDLREPLRKISFYNSSLLAENEHLSLTIKNYGQKIKTATERMQSLLDDLLWYSRVSMYLRLFK